MISACWRYPRCNHLTKSVMHTGSRLKRTPCARMMSSHLMFFGQQTLQFDYLSSHSLPTTGRVKPDRDVPVDEHVSQNNWPFLRALTSTKVVDLATTGMLPLCKLGSFLYLYTIRFSVARNAIYKPVLSIILSENVSILFSTERSTTD